MFTKWLFVKTWCSGFWSQLCHERPRVNVGLGESRPQGTKCKTEEGKVETGRKTLNTEPPRQEVERNTGPRRPGCMETGKDKIPPSQRDRGQGRLSKDEERMVVSHLGRLLSGRAFPGELRWGHAPPTPPEPRKGGRPVNSCSYQRGFQESLSRLKTKAELGRVVLLSFSAKKVHSFYQIYKMVLHKVVKDHCFTASEVAATRKDEGMMLWKVWKSRNR